MMPQQKTSTEIAVGLAPLFEQARREHLWFFSRYQQLWFAPSELAKHQAEGRFRWGAVNWELRSPHERIEELHRTIAGARAEITRFERMIASESSAT